MSVVCVLTVGCTDGRGIEQAPQENLPAPLNAQAPVFTDMAATSGLVFNHTSGATGKFYMPEIMGSGIALFDYDGDDDLDVLVLQGHDLDADVDKATDEVSGQPGHRLFRNELNPSGILWFTDVTDSAGIDNRGYGMGVATGDIDNDGDQDVYVSHFGHNALYLNDGAGHFDEATAGQTTIDELFSSSVAFVDYDADGLLDLFVTNYNSFVTGGPANCHGRSGALDYCDPLTYSPAPDRIFHNLGDGRFADVSAKTGIEEHFGTGLGVVGADFDSDGSVDIYVANDKMANILWINDGHGNFSNVAPMSGVAYNANGKAEASMGVLAGDVDGDGDEDLFMTHLNGQTNTLFLNDGTGFFRDATDERNLGGSSLPHTGFGTIWIDYDNDGDHDVLIANGAVLGKGQDSVGREAAYGQKNQLYRNNGTGRFAQVSDSAGESFGFERISRGAAVGDIDNDGDLDAVISNSDGPVELLINRGVAAHHWLSIRLRGTRSNRDGAGARIALLRENGTIIWRRAHSDGSYLSASDIRVHFGLGETTHVRGVGVIWPTGQRELWENIAADTRIELVEGEGQPWPE
jgi:hypothetical protein